ncbi:MAG: nucleoside hydrolase [Steroidobacterales bacterium]
MNHDYPTTGLTRRHFVAAATAGLGLAGFGTTLRAASPVRSRVIIDTDPGVDDAFALLLAMCSPELRIEAITAVAGNVPLELTLPNALRLVEIANRTDIPVAAGATAPLVRRLVTASYAHGENGLGGAVFPEPKTAPASEPAADLIQRLVRKYPGEITLITIGPQTNIATALNADPGLAHLVRSIVMMGGSLSGGNITPAAEFNVYVDPEAARIVFQSGIPITMVGLDVTRKTTLTEQHVAMLEAHGNPVSQAAAAIGRNSIAHHRAKALLSGPNMHDSVAVAAFLQASIIRTEPFYVDVETSGELTSGETLGYSATAGDLRRAPGASAPADMPVRGSAPLLGSLKSSPVLRDHQGPNARVALDLNAAAFFDLLIGRLGAGT